MPRNFLYRTEVDNIEHLDAAIFRDTGKQLSVCTSRHGNDRREVSPIVFHKFDSLFLLLP